MKNIKKSDIVATILVSILVLIIIGAGLFIHFSCDAIEPEPTEVLLIFNWNVPTGGQQSDEDIRMHQSVFTVDRDTVFSLRDEVLYGLRNTGYEFIGWFLDEDFILPVAFPRLITQNETYYAKWVPL